MAKQDPRLVYDADGLSGRVFVAPKYKERKDGTLEVLERFDVTDAYEAFLVHFEAPDDPDDFEVVSTDWEHGVRRSGDEAVLPLPRAAAEMLLGWFPDVFTPAVLEARRGPWTAP